MTEDNEETPEESRRIAEAIAECSRARSVKHRVSYLTVSQAFNLNVACRELATFGYGTFHVGSSLTRPDYHDVDLRCMLPDDEYDNMFSSDADQRRLKFLNTAISDWVSARTGLPIDFQFQRASDANAEFPMETHRRNGVGF